MAGSGWISAQQRLALTQQVCENLQVLVFHKGGHHSQISWSEKAAAIEAKAFQFTCGSIDEAEPHSALRQVYIREASRLLVAEAYHITQAHHQEKQSNFVLNPVPEGLRQVQTNVLHNHHPFNHKTVWGWLVPGSRALQHVVLKGGGVAIGRGKEAVWGTLNGNSSPRMAASPKCSGHSRGMQEVVSRNLGFVEVADGRVSRLHCLITSLVTDNGVACMLEDCSSNGTFLNGVKLAKGERVSLKDGDRISLVLSVTPLAEQFFTFHSKNVMDAESGEEWMDSVCATVYPAAPGSPSGRRTPRGLAPSGNSLTSSSSIYRSATSRYSTAEESTLEDLTCQICLGPLVQCVALEPCGHNFCAPCLSHHFASQLQGGLQLSCPFRCPMPERVVINTAVRGLMDLLQPQASGTSTSRPFSDSRPPRTTIPPSSSSTSLPSSSTSLQRHMVTNGGAAASGVSDAENSPRAGGMDADSSGSGSEMSMSALCPLHDELLPMDATNLKAKQVEVALQRLKDGSAEAPAHQASLEALARLAWSDDTVREIVASCSGIPAVVEVMSKHSTHDGIQCNACLALMALVRGEGDVCQTNQWHIAKAGAVEAIVRAMTTFRHSAMVQLSALLAFIPLVLENTMMQAHVTQVALGAALAALETFQEEADIQTKGLVLLGVLMQGDDVVHDAIRQRQLEAGLPHCVCRALRRFNKESDDVLWASLFCLAVLTRKPPSDGGPNVFQQVSNTIARSGVLPLLQQSMAAYQRRVEASGGEPDEMIVTAGDYLTALLQPLVQRMHVNQVLVAAGAFACLGVAVAVWKHWTAGPGPESAGTFEPVRMW